MSHLAAGLVAAALAIPHSLAPGETKEDRDPRVVRIAESAWEAAAPFADGRGWTRFETALATIVLQGNESGGFDLRIHAGEVHPIWTQDHGLARCLGQHHVSLLVPAEDWARLAGVDEDATLRCARATTKVLLAHAKLCGVYLGRHATREAIAQTFAAYGSGGHCKPDDEDYRRAKQWESYMAKYGDKPDVPGYRRARPEEVPRVVKDVAKEYLALADREHLGTLRAAPEFAGGERFKIRIERHAEGKIGVSIFVKETE
jgi:hypothetical protein